MWADYNVGLDTEIDVWMMSQMRDSGLWVGHDALP